MHTVMGAGAAMYGNNNSSGHTRHPSTGAPEQQQHGHHGHHGVGHTSKMTSEDMVMVVDGEAVRLRQPTISDLHLHEPMVPPSMAPVWGGGPPMFLRIESLGDISARHHGHGSAPVASLSPRTEAEFMLSPRSPKRSASGEFHDESKLSAHSMGRRSSFVDTSPSSHTPSVIGEESLSPESIGISITDDSGHRRTYTSPKAPLPTIRDSVTPSSRRDSGMSTASVDRPSLVFIDEHTNTSSRTSTPVHSSVLSPTNGGSDEMALLSSQSGAASITDDGGTISSSTSYDRLNAHLHPHVRQVMGINSPDSDSAPHSPLNVNEHGMSWVVPMSSRHINAGARGPRTSKKKLTTMEEEENGDTISPLLKNPLMMRGSARIGEGHHRHHHRHRTKSGDDSVSSSARGLRALKRRRFGRMKLRPADGDYWSQEQLHAMYRMLDVDHDGSVSVPEFTLGLKELGFPTHNKATVRQLQKEIDSKGTGIIRESQFVQFFRGMSRERLRRRLTGLAKRRTTHKLDGVPVYLEDDLVKEAHIAESEIEQAKSPPRLFRPMKSTRERGVSIESKAIAEQDGFGADVAIRVIDCGIIDGQGGQFQTQNVNAHDLLKVLAAGKPREWRRAVRWIDLYGHSDDLMEVLANELELPDTIVDDVSLEQLAKITFFPEDKCMQFVVHALSLSNFPCRPNPDTSGASPYILLEKKQYRTPRLFASQVNILILKDHTIVTVRKRSEDKAVAEMFDPMIDDIRAMMSQKHLTTGHSLRPKELAAQLLREVVEHNYSVRDYFKDWKLAIDEALKGDAQLYHLSHIIAMENLAMLATEILRRAMQVLGHLTEGWSSANLADDHHHYSDSIVLGEGHSTTAPPPLTRLASDAIGFLSPTASHHASVASGGISLSGEDTSSSDGRTPLERVASMSHDRAGGIAQRGLSGIGGSMMASVGYSGAGVSSIGSTVGTSLAGLEASTRPAAGSIGGRRAGVANATHWAIQQSSVTRAQRAHLQARAFLYNYAHQYREVQEQLVKLVQEFAFTREVCRALQVFHDGQREDRMGVILYTMTLVVMLLRPACVLTGLYGMNFQHMPELSREESHPIWLILNGLFVMFGLFWFVKKNYFDF